MKHISRLGAHRMLVGAGRRDAYVWTVITAGWIADMLSVACAAGAHEAALAGVTIPRTGWVAVNRHTVMNSDAALDLGNLVVTLQPTPLSCLSTPVAWNDELVGVLTLYSASPEPFTAAHQTIAEVVASALSHAASRPQSRRAPKPAPILRAAALRLVGTQ